MEINENIKPWRRDISDAEWKGMWEKAIVTVDDSENAGNPLAQSIAEESEPDWMGTAISLYVSRYGRKCVTCWQEVADEDVYLVTRDGKHYMFHSACKPR